jgi:tetratricopeptide (TPR) repeat protein
MNFGTEKKLGPQSFSSVLKLFLFLFLFAVPAFSQSTDEQVGLRLIAVRTQAEAQDLLRQIQSGQSFESVAKAHSTDSSAKDGGFLGTFRLADLKADLQNIVTGLKPGQISPATAVGREFLILQRLTPEEASWIGSYNAGLAAFESARYDDAAQKFLQALPYAEKLRPVDDRLEDNLHGLAEAYRLQKKYADAEPLYRRYMAVHWGGPNAPELVELLDRLSMLVALAYFQDSQFLEARKKFNEAVEHAPKSEGLLMAMGSILFDAQLVDESEALVERAAQFFPMSRGVQYHLAELYRKSWKARKALNIFEKIVSMKAPDDVDPVSDRMQRSVVYQRIGSIYLELAEFDPAEAAYKKALEFTPDSIDARLALGDVYLQQGKTEIALTEYSRALAQDAKSVPAHFRVADANLRMGRFKEASEAAAKVVAMDAGHRKAHYVLATALVRLGAQQEADRELEAYRKLEVQGRDENDRGRNITVMSRSAVSKFMDGQAEEAFEMFRKEGSSTAYLNLGTAQSKLGQHKAAVETFQKMLTENISDSFLVSWHLAQEYQQLGDKDTSLRHRVIYLQNIDVTLREALESNPN